MRLRIFFHLFFTIDFFLWLLCSFYGSRDLQKISKGPWSSLRKKVSFLGTVYGTWYLENFIRHSTLTEKNIHFRFWVQYYSINAHGTSEKFSIDVQLLPNFFLATLEIFWCMGIKKNQSTLEPLRKKIVFSFSNKPEQDRVHIVN